MLNGLEQGVDCGGPDCEPCPTCCDDLMNGDEIGVDCGGNYESNISLPCDNPNVTCGPCPDGVNCVNGIMDVMNCTSIAVVLTAQNARLF